MLSRRPDVVGAVAEAERRLGRNQNLVAAALDGLAENALGLAERIDVRGIEHRHAGIEADIQKAARFGRVSGAPCREAANAAEGTGPKTQGGYHQARAAQASVFHRFAPRLAAN